MQCIVGSFVQEAMNELLDHHRKKRREMLKNSKQREYEESIGKMQALQQQLH